MKPDDKGKHSSRLFYSYIEKVKKISRAHMQSINKQIREAAGLPAVKTLQGRLEAIGYMMPPTWLNSSDNSETVKLSGFNRYRVIYNQQQPPKANPCRSRSEPVSQTKPNDSPATSTRLMLAMAVKGMGFYDPNHKGKGKQADAVRFFEKQLVKEGLTGQYLSGSTLRDNLDKALDTLKQYAVLDKKDDK
ncbi:hypothetical protein [Endozoicomonas sp. ONNA2]|uniref:hypothetical protein n=1 Tax=Endozoicomonas sp. ONNA2 TaxID=2828741 RepID=UPI00214989E5|nr:hypothetical protein [Endozoicomonas sp. ONNA2]